MFPGAARPAVAKPSAAEKNQRKLAKIVPRSDEGHPGELAVRASCVGGSLPKVLCEPVKKLHKRSKASSGNIKGLLASGTGSFYFQEINRGRITLRGPSATTPVRCQALALMANSGNGSPKKLSLTFTYVTAVGRTPDAPPTTAQIGCSVKLKARTGWHVIVLAAPILITEVKIKFKSGYISGHHIVLNGLRMYSRVGMPAPKPLKTGDARGGRPASRAAPVGGLPWTWPGTTAPRPPSTTVPTPPSVPVPPGATAAPPTTCPYGRPVPPVGAPACPGCPGMMMGGRTTRVTPPTSSDALTVKDRERLAKMLPVKPVTRPGAVAARVSKLKGSKKRLLHGRVKLDVKRSKASSHQPSTRPRDLFKGSGGMFQFGTPNTGKLKLRAAAGAPMRFQALALSTQASNGPPGKTVLVLHCAGGAGILKAKASFKAVQGWQVFTIATPVLVDEVVVKFRQGSVSGHYITLCGLRVYEEVGLPSGRPVVGVSAGAGGATIPPPPAATLFVPTALPPPPMPTSTASAPLPPLPPSYRPAARAIPMPMPAPPTTAAAAPPMAVEAESLDVEAGELRERAARLESLLTQRDTVLADRTREVEALMAVLVRLLPH